MNRQRDEITLKDLTDIFIPKIWLIVLVALVFGGAFGGYSMFFKQNTYTSTAIYMIGKVPYSNSASETVGLNSSEVEAMQTMIENSMQIINATDFAEDVLDKIKEHDVDNSEAMKKIAEEHRALVHKIDDKRDSLERERRNTSNADRIAVLEAEIKDLETTLKVLEDMYPNIIADLERPLITQEQIDAINSIDVSRISYNTIKNSMSVSLTGDNTTCYTFTVTTSDPKLSLAIATAAGEILSERLIDTGYAIKVDCIGIPRLAISPDSKNVVRNSVVGFAAGALLTMLAVFVISKLDVIVRSKEKLENTFNIPVIGMIPSFGDDD